ncbi:MAG TPA: alpha/beta hydrolase [Candidatus Angelobacter sp.]|nr:alpha/beta hydrolase [Candidatus Angelobacter sp.]
MANLATMLIGLERFSSGMKRNKVQVGDHRVVYSEGGHGEPGVPSKSGFGLMGWETVVLLHGFGASADSWNRFAKPLTKRYRVIAPDQPGWGASTRLEGASYGYPAQVERLHQFLSALGLKRVHLVGHSMGGFIASAYAARYPDEVITVGLIAPHGMIEPEPGELARDVAKGDNWLVATSLPEFDRLLSNVFARRPYAPKAVVRYLGNHAVRNSAKSAQIFAEMQVNDPPLAELLPKINAPSLIVWGDQDRVLHVSCADLFRQGIKNSELMVIPGSGHMPMIENARACSGAWLAFADKSRQARGAAA